MPDEDVHATLRKLTIGLGLKYAKYFREGTFGAKDIADRYVTRVLCQWLYSAMVTEKMMPPIESQSKELQGEFWKDTLIHAAHLDDNGKVAFMKGYYALGHIIEVYDNL